MDVFSHTLWSRGLFGSRGHPWIAVLVGCLPDLIPFAPMLVLRIVEGAAPGRPELEAVPEYTFIAYNFTHSLVIAAACVGAAALWRRDVAFAMLGWPFHVLLDVPFHTAEFFPTPIAWPLSDWVFDGVSWGHPAVWYPNLAGLVVLYAWRIRAWRKKRRQHA